MFGIKHFIWIIMCIMFTIVMDYIGVKRKMTLKEAGLIMSFICLLSESSKIMCNMIESSFGGMVLNPLALPFHLCSMMLFGVLYITFGKDGEFKDKLIDFVAVMGILGSIMAILIPTDGVEFTSILVYQCFVYHGGLLWFGTYLIIGGCARIDFASYKRNIVILLGLVLLMIYVNSILSVYGTNFMFLTRPPLEGLPIINLDHGWFVYFGTIVMIGLVVISLFYLLFMVINKRRRIHEEKSCD